MTVREKVSLQKEIWSRLTILTSMPFSWIWPHTDFQTLSYRGDRTDRQKLSRTSDVQCEHKPKVGTWKRRNFVTLGNEAANKEARKRKKKTWHGSWISLAHPRPIKKPQHLSAANLTCLIKKDCRLAFSAWKKGNEVTIKVYIFLVHDTSSLG